MSGWDEPNIMSTNKKPRIEDKAQVLKYPADEYVDMRLFGPLFSIVFYWFEIRTKDGKKVSIPKICLDYDPIKQKFVSDICPYRASGAGRMQQVFYSNAIIRDLQKLAPKKEPKHTRFERKQQPLVPGSKELFFVKENGSKSYTPVRLVKLTSTIMESIARLSKLNKHKVKGERKTFPLAHHKYGMDISISFDPNASGSNMYDVQKGDPSAIKERETNYLMQPFFSEAIKPEPLKIAKKEMERIRKSLISKADDDDDDDEDKKNRDKDKGSSKNRRNRERNRDSERSSGKSGKKNKNKERKSSSDKSDKNKKRKKRNFTDDEIPF